MPKRRDCRPTKSIALLALDGRSRLSQSIVAARDAFLAMVPQPPSPADMALAERLAVLSGHLSVLDARAFEGPLSASDIRLFTTLSGQHARLLKLLTGRRASRPSGPSLDELFADRREGAAA